MKISISKSIAMVLCIILSACSSNDSLTDEQASKNIIEISKLTYEFDDSIEEINLGNSSASIKEVTEKITIKNKTQSPFNFQIEIDSGSFKIKTNRCGVILSPNKSCDLTVTFTNRGLYDGEYSSVLSLNSNKQILLKASVSGAPDPNQVGESRLVLELDSPFEPLGNIPYRTLIIKNEGLGTAKNIDPQLPNEYSIRLNRCPKNLLPKQSCSIQILLKNFRSIQNSPEASLVVVSNNSQNSIELKSGTSQIPSNNLSMTYSKYVEELTINTLFSTTPNVAGGSAPYLFQISPSLPSGLTLNTSTGQISGQISSVLPLSSYTVTVVDSLSHQVQRTIQLSSKTEAFTLTYSLPSKLYLNSNYSFSPQIQGGVGVSYSISCDKLLPGGLIFNQFSGIISGSTTQEKEIDCLISATDSLSRIASYRIVTETKNVPLSLSYSSPSYNINVGESFSITPTLIGATSNYYQISPGLTRGLNFESSTGRIYGTPNGVGSFTQNYTVTVFTASGSTSQMIQINYVYVSENVPATVEVQVLTNFVEINNIENQVSPILTIPLMSIDGIGTVGIEGVNVLPSVESIDPSESYTNIPPLAYSILTPLNNVISTIFNKILHLSTMKITIKNNGQEQLDQCRIWNIDNTQGDNCITGPQTIAGSYYSTQNYVRDLTHSYGLNKTKNEMNLYIKKNGAGHSFNIYPSSVPVITSKKLTNLSNGVYPPAYFNYGDIYLRGQKKISLQEKYNFSYNGKTYFVINTDSQTKLYSYDGNTISEFISMFSVGDVISNLNLIGNKLYFVNRGADVGYRNIYQLNMDTKDLVKINPGSGIESTYPSYTLFSSGILFTDWIMPLNQSGRYSTFFYNFYENKVYGLGNASHNNGDGARKYSFEVQGGFVFSADQSNGSNGLSGVYLATYKDNQYSVRRISMLNNGLTYGDSCVGVGEQYPLIYITCPIDSIRSVNKFFAYNRETNVFFQLTQIYDKTKTDYNSSTIRKLENGTIVFYSNSPTKLYRIKNGVVEQISNLSGNDNTSDPMDTTAAGVPIVVKGNKAYVFVTISGSDQCWMEYDDDVSVNYFKQVFCKSQTSRTSIQSDVGASGIDNQGNLFFHNFILKASGEVIDLDGIFQYGLFWFKNGKAIFTDYNKYYYFDGNRKWQISNTIGVAATRDSDFKMAWEYNGKILLYGKDSASNKDQLWEISLPSEVMPP